MFAFAWSQRQVGTEGVPILFLFLEGIDLGQGPWRRARIQWAWGRAGKTYSSQTQTWEPYEHMGLNTHGHLYQHSSGVFSLDWGFFSLSLPFSYWDITYVYWDTQILSVLLYQFWPRPRAFPSWQGSWSQSPVEMVSMFKELLKKQSHLDS